MNPGGAGDKFLHASTDIKSIKNSLSGTGGGGPTTVGLT